MKLSVKAGMGNWGTEWGECGEWGWECREWDENAGSITEIEKTKWKFIKSNSLFWWN